MAYVPDHLADVFISYCHDDDFAWIERFKQDLEGALIRKLRARTKPEMFFDAKNLRAGRVFDAEIAACLERTGFFLAMVSPRYNASTYCRHKELTKFLSQNPPESGRLIQILLDVSARLPAERSLGVPFADTKGAFRADAGEYLDALRRVYEPVVSELDRLYAASKLVFLAWPGDDGLEEDRKRLQSEIEGRGLRVFPEEVGEFDSDVKARLRDALSQSTTSVHLFGQQPNEFDLQQWDAAVRVGKPCILASRNRREARRRPAGSPAPIFLEQGNPTIEIANAIERIAGIGKREEGLERGSLGKTPIFLVHEPDSDKNLDLTIKQRITSSGPFEVIVAAKLAGTGSDELERAKVALLCLKKAGTPWLTRELETLRAATFQRKDLRRALLLLRPSEDVADPRIRKDYTVLHSLEALKPFLVAAQGAAA